MNTIESIAFSDFRNYESLVLKDLGSLTVLVGPNAVGKTNIIEGIQLLTALSTFRHGSIQQMVRFGQPHGRLKATVRDGDRSLDIALFIEDSKRTYQLNGKNKRPSDLKGLTPAVTFTPDDLSLVKGSMDVRRRALDALGSQLNGRYHQTLKDYEKVLRHKNRILKEEASDALLDSINEMLITCGSQLTVFRGALFERLESRIATHYSTIAPAGETLAGFYVPSWIPVDETAPASFKPSRDEARDNLAQALEIRREDERIRHRSLVGPHCDSIWFAIDGMNATLFGSQGQQRSIVLSYKLGEAMVIEELLQKKPVMLLDDVMSELDAARREALVAYTSNDVQTFITTANLSYFSNEILENAHVIHLPIGKR